MSDESQPPALRLKPRLRPGEPGTDAPPTSPPPEAPPAAPVPPTAESGDASPRLRLKPKLTGAGSEATGAGPSAPVVPEEIPPPERPASSAPSPAEAAAPSDPQPVATPLPTAALLRPKLRLSAEPAASAPAAPAVEPAGVTDAPPAPAPAVTSVPPPEAAPTDEAPPASAPPPVDPAKFPPPPIKRPAPAAAPAPSLARPPGRPEPGAPKPENRPLFKAALLVVTVAAVGVLAAGLYFAYDAFIAKETTAPEPAVVTSPASDAQGPAQVPGSKEPHPPAKAVEEPAAPRTAIGQRVRQTTDAAAARVAEIPLDDIEPTPASPAPKSVEPTVTPSPAPAPTVQPTPPAPVRPAEPDAAFQLWVSEARISGVRRGAEARAFINGRLVRQGEIVDNRLGIRFEGVDPAQNILRFRDAAGAVIGKKF